MILEKDCTFAVGEAAEELKEVVRIVGADDVSDNINERTTTRTQRCGCSHKENIGRIALIVLGAHQFGQFR